MFNSEETWIAGQRANARRYLREQGVRHLGVGDYPAFHVHPYLTLWAVQSKTNPGWIGWWVVSGDVPTDCIEAGDARHPRDALRRFARIWREVSEFMLRGEQHPEVVVGTPDQWPELGELLLRRAAIIQSYADDDEIWPEE